jgi:hypothetical protein
MKAKKSRQEKLAEAFPEHPIRTHRATLLMILLAAGLLSAGSLSAAESWWQTYTPVATAGTLRLRTPSFATYRIVFCRQED